MGQAPPIVSNLVERFDRNREAYKNHSYNETQVRREFLDPFFEALGWDVANKESYAEAYKDVIHEDAIKIGSNIKAPDYCFRIGGARKFFLEAKKPAVNLKDELSPAYQLRRYAWSAKLPLSILTDFEEFAVYDCRTRPNPSDKPGIGRVHYWTFQEYLAKWDEIAAIFSKEAVLKGSFDKYAITDRKRGTATVDAEFLKEIETWRESLAKNLALRNPKLTVHELNFAVQRTIDRLIFLRIAEDRGIEPYAQLQALLSGQNIYARLRHLYAQADDRYNSGLFHFQAEKDRAEAPDELTPSLKIDDKTLKDIIGRLYYPNSPYEFSVFPTEILGQVYEQFLGKVIRLTSNHQAKVEEKPEVKKAGGVYYTPAYIVEYIVKQTVGMLCEGKTPKQISKLTILDPACGSGSFLIGAYRFLLNFHRDWYVKDGPEKHRKELFQAASGEWRLKTQEKKRILLNNIYGVDIDSQAVEVTKLSLLLKVLEGENQESLQEMLFGRVRVLPDLGLNIKCGNSLIGPDYSAGQLIPDDEEMRRVNPFDWKVEFSEIMKAGGFDAVIGNPPYVRIQVMKEWAPHEVEIYKKLFTSASKGNYDIYVVFVERGLHLLNKSGRLGFILPHKFFQAQYGAPLRYLISSGKHLAKIIHFGDQQVFEGATTYTCLLFLEKRGIEFCHFNRVENLSLWKSAGQVIDGSIPAKSITSGEWNFSVGAGAALFEKLGRMSERLGDIAGRLAQGIRTSANEVYVLDVISTESKLFKARSRHLGRHVEVERGVTSLFLQGREIKPYRVLHSGKVVIIPYQVEEGHANLIPLAQLKEKFPKMLDYLNQNRTYLEERESGRMRGSSWFGYIYPKNIEFMRSPKILVPDIADRASFAYDENGDYAFTSGYGVTLKENIAESPKYVLGLLNSKVLDFYLKRISTPMRGGFFRYFTQFIEQLPIRRINFSHSSDKAAHGKMVLLVERMLDLHQRLSLAKTPADKERLQRQIDPANQAIDRLVYDLYGLTEDEIKIVEEASVASSVKVKENEGHETDTQPADRSDSIRSSSATVAEAAQYPSEGVGGASESPAGEGEPVHGVRESTGQYGPPQDPDSEAEGQGKLGSTREFDTAEGRLSYSELSERLAVPLVAIYDEILQVRPDQVVITSEWLCLRHKRLAGHLFPDWAGRFRDVNVQVGGHTPPPFYEVPVHMRQFCGDLAERLRHNPGASIRSAAEFLAWADWRFQWIHPFKDFNGRIGRVLLAALLYKLGLPHVEMAPGEPVRRSEYLHALPEADSGLLDSLQDLWIRRLAEST
ncbi:MAG: Eco57I restriction-modification methylase domain-containing protein [Nitrospira sp.]|nr:Eco57I restriction-modification methylase domain-containing protein [Nitrospira sp.]